MWYAIIWRATEEGMSSLLERKRSCRRLWFSRIFYSKCSAGRYRLLVWTLHDNRPMLTITSLRKGWFLSAVWLDFPLIYKQSVLASEQDNVPIILVNFPIGVRPPQFLNSLRCSLLSSEFVSGLHFYFIVLLLYLTGVIDVLEWTEFENSSYLLKFLFSNSLGQKIYLPWLTKENIIFSFYLLHRFRRTWTSSWLVYLSQALNPLANSMESPYINYPNGTHN